MRTAIVLIVISFLLVGIFCANEPLIYAEPTIPQSDLPADTPDAIKKAIEMLYSSSEDEQLEALRQLGGMGKEASKAVPFLISMMDNASVKIKQAIAKSLGEIGDTASVDLLIKALKDENDSVAYNAAIALGKLKDPKAKDPLLEAILSSSKYVRQYSAEALGEIGDASTAKYLLGLLKDIEPEVREAAAVTLGKINNKGAIKYLLPLLEDVRPSVRYRAAEALAKLFDMQGDLSDLAKNLYATDKMERLKAAEGLVEMGSIEPKLVPFLCGLLGEGGILGKKAAEALASIGETAVDSINNSLKSSNATTRANAISALGKIGKGKSVKLIIETLDDNDESVHTAAEKTLVSIGQPAVTDLISSLSDKRVNVRIHTARALGDIKDAASVDPLITALNDSNADVRANAASALGKIGDRKAVTPLITAISDTSWQVRSNAAEALGLLQDVRATDALIAAMRDIKTEVRIKIIDALGEIKYDKTIESLMPALSDPNRDIQYHTADALSKITGEDFGRDMDKWKQWREKQLISKLLDYNAEVDTKVMALKLLQETRNPDYIETLFLVLKRDKTKPEITENTAEALRKITGEDFGRDADAWDKWWRRDLIAELQSDERSKRVKTAIRLGELRNTIAIAPLIAKMKDTFADMREAAAKSLEQITGQQFGTDAAAWEYWWDTDKLKSQRSS